MYDESRCNYREAFTIFLTELSAALHARGHKLSECVGFYPTRSGGLFDQGSVNRTISPASGFPSENASDRQVSMFYDPKVIADKVDIIRVMNCESAGKRLSGASPASVLTAHDLGLRADDMYYGPGAETIGGGRASPDQGRGVNSSWPNGNRPDCGGIGPTSSQPWARAAMTWWAQHVPLSKLVMGLPSCAPPPVLRPSHHPLSLRLPDSDRRQRLQDFSGRSRRCRWPVTAGQRH